MFTLFSQSKTNDKRDGLISATVRLNRCLMAIDVKIKPKEGASQKTLSANSSFLSRSAVKLIQTVFCCLSSFLNMFEVCASIFYLSAFCYKRDHVVRCMPTGR